MRAAFRGAEPGRYGGTFAPAVRAAQKIPSPLVWAADNAPRPDARDGIGNEADDLAKNNPGGGSRTRTAISGQRILSP